MNDFEGLLATNYGFKPQGKAAPMAASKGTSNINPTSSPTFDLGSRASFRSANTSNSYTDDHDSLNRSMGSHENREFGGFDDLLGGSGSFSRKPDSRGGDSDVNLDSLFHGSTNSGQPASSLPVYDKPVYDDDIFDGIPGLRSSSKVQYDDVFSSMTSPPKADAAFDDLLGGFSKSDGIPKSTGGKGAPSKDKNIPAFDDLLPGFRGSSPPGDRSTSGASWSSEPASGKTSSKPVEDPFEVSRQRTADPHEEVSDIGNLKSPKFDGYPSSDANDRAFDDVDPFASLGKSVPSFSSEGSNRGKARSPPRVDGSAAGPQNSNIKETVEKSSGRTSGHPLKNDVSAKNDRQFDQPVFDMPTVSTDSHKFVPRSTSPPAYTASKDSNMMEDTPRFQDNVEPDEVWLTVSEIPLFTQPTVAPPPSRPPPPIPQQVPKDGIGPYGSRSSKMNANDFSSFPNSTHHFQSPKSASASMRDQVVSSVDELEEFAMGRSQSNADEQVNGLSNEELEMNSAAAAMKEAMDRAEAKFKHAKEVRERESTRTSRSKEAVYWDKDEKVVRNDRAEDEESMDHERFQREREEKEKEKEKRRAEKERERARELEREREEKEKEQRRLEKERERARELEMERMKARQAVERATREARERAAAEARLKAERAAVDKVNAGARERAERAAVQRAQAEARERAAADARERAERAAVEAREKVEKAAAEAKEREARERASGARAEAEARSRAERAAVERAAAEARERAAVEARDRAAAAARANQQKNENDLESFFSMGNRASSAPRPRAANPMDNFFDTQSPNRPESETTKASSATSSSMRKASSTTNIVDDLSSIFGGPPSSGEFQEVDGETEERRRARLERHQRVQTRAAKALAEKNERDLQMQRDQAERHRIAETLDVEIKRWAAGKEGNLRALLSTLQYVLWPECGWQPVSLTEMVIPNAVKKVYRKATLCIHPDKVQQKGATLQQKYVAEKVFDILKEAWNKFNSEELF